MEIQITSSQDIASLNVWDEQDYQYVEKLIIGQIHQCSEILGVSILRKCSNIVQLQLLQVYFYEWDVFEECSTILQLKLCFIYYDVSLHYFKNCADMEEIILDHVSICDLGSIGYFKKLQTLHISWCDKVIDFSVLENCSCLVDLQLSMLQINNLNFLCQMTILQKLSISDCVQIETFKPLKNCCSIQKIDIYPNMDDISPCVNLKHLSSMILTNNHKLPYDFQQYIENDFDYVLEIKRAWKATQKYKIYKQNEGLEKMTKKRRFVHQSVNNFRTSIYHHKQAIQQRILHQKRVLLKIAQLIIQYQV